MSDNPRAQSQKYFVFKTSHQPHSQRSIFNAERARNPHGLFACFVAEYHQVRRIR